MFYKLCVNIDVLFHSDIVLIPNDATLSPAGGLVKRGVSKQIEENQYREILCLCFRDNIVWNGFLYIIHESDQDRVPRFNSLVQSHHYHC